MGKKNNSILITAILVFGIIFSSYQSANAAVRSWNSGDVFYWGQGSETITQTTKIAENVSTLVIHNYMGDLKVNITDVDPTGKVYDAYITSTPGWIFYEDIDYSWDNYASKELVPSSFYNINYNWDFEHNRTVCDLFEIELDFEELIEPDWESLNDAFASLFDEDIILDTVNCPFNSTTYNLTVGTLFNVSEYKIMGEDDITNALPKFTATNSMWTFSFNLSNYVMFEYHNGSMFIYRPYEYYYQQITLEYSEGGVLNQYSITLESSITFNGVQTNYFHECIIVLGGIDNLPDNIQTETKTISAAFNGSLVTITAIISCTAAVIIKKRRKSSS
ncbi:MAG: hypothetical protein ACTSO7_06720 [Candidatus Heimdallarchaeota archaeon]